MNNQSTVPRPSRPAATFVSAKISEEHLQLGAALYVRQSTSAQLREHQESTARQYALKDRLVAFGWPDDRVIVIDDDLGISGSGHTERPGFRRLLKLVTDQQVGVVLGLEMSRLARNSKDWHDLFEVCAIFHTLIADEDGVFDPQDPNDRLVLGLKGIIAELELHTMKVRLERGRLNKAQRGELFHDVPVGYVLDEQGLPQLDPDESARHVMKIFFDLFESLGSSHALFHHLAQNNIRLPFRENRRGQSSRIDWRLPGKTTVYELLKHPLYAGAYGYGRRKNYRQKQGKQQRQKHLPPDQWKVLIKDLYPAYISWAGYESNQHRLRENDNVGDRSGPVRGGSALLAGIVMCAHCGRRLSPSYPRNTHAIYQCGRHRTVAHAEPCHSSIRCATLDEFVASKLLDVLAPAGVDLSLQVIEDEQTRREQLGALHGDRVEQARYAVDLAERRFKHVDPANRLVAGRLEREWEAALAELEVATTELDQLRSRQPVKLSDAERQGLRKTCGDIVSLWRERATVAERKQIVRLLLRRVEVEVHNNTERVSVRLHWSGGFESSHEITRTVMQFHQLDAYEQLIDRVLQLTLAGQRTPQVAAILEREGFRSPRSDTPISPMMVQKLLLEQPRCREQLTNPSLEPHHWRSAYLARELGIPEKRLKDWVTRGWASAIQRPFGRVWIIYADERELQRLQQLASSQTGQGRPAPTEKLRTPTPISRGNSIES
ncbi:MAG: recombinase family protein [Nitrospira sp.]|nr:recombinase family protein [Nitrospira sp.]